MPFCSVCAASVTAGQESCAKCGARLPALPSSGTPPSDPVAVSQAASPSRRILAAVIDGALTTAFVVFLFVVAERRAAQFLLRPSRMAEFFGMFIAFLPFLLAPIYPLFRDALGGKSIGKLITGITAVNVVRRRHANLRDSFFRNAPFLLLMVPLLGVFIGAGLVLLITVQIVSGKRQRLGDGLADTVVMDDRDARSVL